MKSRSIAIIALTALFVFSSLAIEVAPEGNVTVLSRSLLERIENREDNMEVIIRFEQMPTGIEYHSLRTVGLEPIHTFEFIKAVYAKGPAAAVLRSTNIGGVVHIEYNEALEYHMDITTSVVNATLTWNTLIKDQAGNLDPAIDGEGVTAVVIDTGIDAGHPDLDYGTKTIMNLKSDTGITPWVELENSDTSSGHGTHCAGTVAGNGDASGGARAGVAPGARLIGMSTGDGPMIINAIGAMDWVYENTRPGHNPYNIRVVSNSWGMSGEYDPENAVNEGIRRITYDNNVVWVMSAGNSGGENHDGHEVTTSPYSIEPSALNIAAMSHDGKSMASFSSRGIADDDFTWPDFGAPGVAIWSTAARRTYLNALTLQGRGDAYYFAISGTSMSCPHVSGMVALLWQACPELRVSEMSGDNSLADESWHNDPNNYMHEAEVILKLASHYIDPKAENGVPTMNATGLVNKSKDFAQGYGIIDTKIAVDIAATLHTMRQEDMETTVMDAYYRYMNISEDANQRILREQNTDTLETYWHGEWGQLSQKGSFAHTDQSRWVWIPEEASKMVAELEYSGVKFDNLLDATAVSLSLTYDEDLDNQSDWTASSDSEEIDLAGKGGKFWAFDVIGQGVSTGVITGGLFEQYKEARMEYTVKLRIFLSPTENDTIVVNSTDYQARVAQWDFAPPSGPTNMTIALETMIFDTSEVFIEEAPPPVKEEGGIGWLLALAALAAIGIAFYMWSKKKRPFEVGVAQEELPSATVIDAEVSESQEGEDIP